MAKPEKTIRTASEGTRQALIGAGLRLFGEKGYEATSTRDIAAAAKANIASISYHFGGKEGLRTACAGAIVDQMSAILGPAATQPDEPDKLNKPLSADQAIARIEAAVRAIVMFMIGNREGETVATFILREVTQPSSALDKIYGELIEPFHTKLCQYWALATGADADSEQTRIEVFAVLGQIIYFRIGRPIVMRRLGWSAMAPRQVEQILDVLLANVRAQIMARQGEKS